LLTKGAGEDKGEPFSVEGSSFLKKEFWRRGGGDSKRERDISPGKKRKGSTGGPLYHLREKRITEKQDSQEIIPLWGI